MMELEILVADAPAGVRDFLERVARECCRLEGLTRVEVYARLVDDAAIHALNRETRGVDRPTDVLSYPSVDYPYGTARDHVALLRRELDPETGRMCLGEFVISLDRAREQAAEYGHSVTRELGYLTAHAMFHLMGYDHMTEEECQVMRRQERAVMAALELTREGRDVSDEQLFELAGQAMERAYAPYSGFRVGACLLTEDGRTFQGCNVENASYGATICAERGAVMNAVREGATRFVAIAVAAEQRPAWPCGVCRQVLSEFSVDMRVLVGQKGGAFESLTLSELLPHSFGPAQLDASDGGEKARDN